MLRPPAQAHRFNYLGRPLRSLFDPGAGDPQGKLDVLISRQQRQQAEGLENETQLTAPQFGELALVHRRDLEAIDHHVAGARPV